MVERESAILFRNLAALGLDIDITILYYGGSREVNCVHVYMGTMQPLIAWRSMNGKHRAKGKQQGKQEARWESTSDRPAGGRESSLVQTVIA